MPDKELTDEQIVTDLKLYLENRECVYCGREDEELTKILNDALDLINRLQAENERSKDYIATLEKEVDWYRDELRHSDKKVANKAYKEVFEKINEKAEVRKIKIFGRLHILKVVLLHDINEIKYEMVGEDNGKM